ncbi:class II fructose-bisphosphate aldolase [Micromonospora sp. DR5-3]|uniref:class II fructose-bisphosphate aldolase n=1 Tax=unclassified Micromonospora TaxID=2617518 RepID=UPI0011D68294|nr:MULTISPECIES: class II fructose-bisphosphate aldolase [unclassified Micromonospora]MCW3814335.1 class II fructose-bisphosphate aldolase [Micromonospora sp. DR5-3]TYC23367.1 class II fructose-bisphosphate aldolase family protein [Micromonospora sp. MP36]
MPLVPTEQVVAAGPVCAFNAISLEHAEAIVAGAEAAGRPVILQISENAVRFHDSRLAPIAAATRAVAAMAAVDVALHLDHVVSPDLWRQAPEHGFGSIMVDASRLAYQENVATTRAVAEFAHARGLWVEAELGTIGGKDGEPPVDPHAPGSRTDPAEAASYVAQTGVDALAVAVGSTHAMTTRSAVLDHSLIGRLRAAVAVPLVLHGSSGVPDAELRRAVLGGIIKVNIGTALNVAFTDTVRDTLAARPELVDPRRYLASARGAMAETVTRFCRLVSGDATPQPTVAGRALAVTES